VQRIKSNVIGGEKKPLLSIESSYLKFLFKSQIKKIYNLIYKKITIKQVFYQLCAICSMIFFTGLGFFVALIKKQ
jgi:hypothetical protein